MDHEIVAHIKPSEPGEKIGDPVLVTVNVVEIGNAQVQVGGLGASGSFLAKIGDTIPISIKSSEDASGNQSSTPFSGDSVGYALLNLTKAPSDIAIDGLTWNPAIGGADVAYRVEGGSLPVATTIKLYWSKDGTYQASEDTLIPNSTINVPQSAGTYSAHVDASSFIEAPVGTRYLIAVADPDHLVQDDDRFVAVKYDPVAISAPSPSKPQVTSLDSKHLSFSYDVTEASSADGLDLAVYRSNGPGFDPGSAQFLQFMTITSTSTDSDLLRLGHHDIAATLDKPLGIDPTHEFVFIVVDLDDRLAHSPIGQEPAKNEAYFRKFVLGALTHGFNSDGDSVGLPPWVVSAQADLINSDRYDDAIEFDWLADSNKIQFGLAVAAGPRKTSMVVSAADKLVSSRGRSGDVVDIHLVGHSRGAVVVSQVAQDLVGTEDSAVAGGYKKVTLLDPHPANNNFSSPDYSISAPAWLRFIALTVYRDFQDTALDPQIVIPSNIDEADDYYQQTDVANLSYLGFLDPTRRLNLWGEGPSLVNVAPSVKLNSLDLTNVADPLIGTIYHGTVPDYYIEYVLRGSLAR